MSGGFSYIVDPHGSKFTWEVKKKERKMRKKEDNRLEEEETTERNLAQESKELEGERVRKATEEISLILAKYDVQIEGIAVIKATEIRIIPKRG